MRKLETTLERATNRTYEQEARLASARLAESAANSGLLDVAYTTLESPFGDLLVAATPRGLVRLAFSRTLDVDEVLRELSTRISPRVLEAASYFDGVRTQLAEYFEGRRTSFGLPLDWSLTGGFGRRVLKRTARIPYGGISTYRKVARAAGNEYAARAAGNALGGNPIPILLPCHRVLHSGGGLGGYGGGLDMKESLLRLEGAIL
jgi:methylated-DNA-[protein]-cysteine S-methyltransferase